MEKLQKKLEEITNDLVQILCDGRTVLYDNKDVLEFEPNTLSRVQDLISKRNLLIDLIKENDKASGC